MAITVVFPERDGGSAEEIATALEACQAAQVGAEAAEAGAQAILDGLPADAAAAIDAAAGTQVADAVAVSAAPGGELYIAVADGVADIAAAEAAILTEPTGTLPVARDAALASIGADDSHGARGGAVAAVQAQEAASVGVVQAQQATSVAAVVTQQSTSAAAVTAAGDAKLAAIAAATVLANHVYTSTSAAESDGALANGSYYMLLLPGVAKLYLKVSNVSSTYTGFSTRSGSDPVQSHRQTLATYDNQVSKGVRTFPKNEVNASQWTLTGAAVRNANGSYTGGVGDTMTIILSVSPFITAGTREAYATRLDDKTGGNTIYVEALNSSSMHVGDLATAASTLEPVAGCYKQVWSNSSAYPRIRITITWLVAGDVSLPEIFGSASTFGAAIERYDEITPVLSPPVRTDLFEFWKRPAGEPMARRALLDEIQYAASTAGNGRSAAVTVSGAITAGVFAAGAPTGGTLGGGLVLSGGTVAYKTQIAKQTSGTAGLAGNYLVSPDNQTTASATLTATPGTVYAPWTTLAALPAAINGTKYGLQAGSLFREDFTQIRVTSYGTMGNTVMGFQVGSALEAFPIISAFEQIATGDWTDNGDGTFTCVKDVTGPVALQHDDYEEIMVVEIDTDLEAAGLYFEARRMMWNVHGGTFTASIASDGTITVTGTPTTTLEPGMGFTGAGVDPATIISAFQIDTGSNNTGIGKAGKYLTTPTGQTAASTTMTVTDRQAVKANAGNKAVGLAANTATITIRPTGDVAVGGKYRYEFVRRWCPIDAGDYGRDLYLFGLDLQGSNYGYGALAGPQRTVADRIIVRDARAHAMVAAGGSVTNFLAVTRNSYSNGVTYYSSTDPSGRGWQLKRGLIDGDGGPIYCHRGASGDWAMGEIEDLQVRSSRSTRPWNYGALYGDIAGGSNILRSRMRRVYARGFQTTGIHTATSGNTDSTMKECVFRQIGKFRPRKLTQDVIACVENISNPRISAERNMRMIEMYDAQVIENVTLIATNTVNSLADYKPTVISTSGTIATKPILRKALILIFPQLGLGDSVFTALPSGGVPLFELHNSVIVFGPGSGFTVTQASGAATTDLDSLKSRIGDDGTNTWIDARNVTSLDVFLRNFALGDLRWANNSWARQAAQACKVNDAGCRITLDRWPYEPTLDEYVQFLREF